MVSGNERTFSPLPFGRRDLSVLRVQTWNGKPSTVPDCSVVAAYHTPGKDVLKEISSCMPRLSLLVEQLHDGRHLIGIVRVECRRKVAYRWHALYLSRRHVLDCYWSVS